MTEDELDDIIWFHPGSYPERCSGERALAIARDIALGATPQIAAAKHGVPPHRFRQWMKWGQEADERGADATDLHAAYHNLFLMVCQAIGILGTETQHRVRRESAQWFILHHPELRGEWGGDVSSTQLLLSSPQAEVVEAEASSLSLPSVTETREVLRTLIEAGLAVPAPMANEVSCDTPDTSGQELLHNDDQSDRDERTGTG